MLVDAGMPGAEAGVTAEEREPVLTWIKPPPEEGEVTAWLIMHTPRDQSGLGLCPGHDPNGGPGSDTCTACGKQAGYEDSAHAFGPFFGEDEVYLWLASPDLCDKTVMPFVGVRPCVVGPLDAPPDPSDGRVH